MSARDTRRKLNIDLTEVYERIENCRSDEAWKALSQTQRVLVLIKERLSEIEGSEKP